MHIAVTNSPPPVIIIMSLHQHKEQGAEQKNRWAKMRAVST